MNFGCPPGITTGRIGWRCGLRVEWQQSFLTRQRRRKHAGTPGVLARQANAEAGKEYKPLNRNPLGVRGLANTTYSNHTARIASSRQSSSDSIATSHDSGSHEAPTKEGPEYFKQLQSFNNYLDKVVLEKSRRQKIAKHLFEGHQEKKRTPVKRIVRQWSENTMGNLESINRLMAFTRKDSVILGGSKLVRTLGLDSSISSTIKESQFSRPMKQLKRRLSPATIPLAPIQAHVVRTRGIARDRNFCISSQSLQAQAVEYSKQEPQPPPVSAENKTQSIRDSLRLWQVKYDQELQQKLLAVGVDTHKNVETTESSVQSFFQSGSGTEGDNIGESKPDYEDSMQLEEEALIAEQHLKPGALVELMSNDGSLLAVYTRRFESQLQFYTMYGRWLHRTPRQPLFALQDFVSAPELVSLLPYLPDEEVPEAQLDILGGLSLDVPRSIGAPIVKRINDFVNEADEVYRLNAHKIDKVYEILAKDRHNSLTHIKEIARHLLNIPLKANVSNTALWTIHRAMMLDESGFYIPDSRSHWLTGMWEVLSRADVDVAKQMQIWVREHQEYVIAKLRQNLHTHDAIRAPQTSVLAGFAKRVRPIILESRKHRALTPYGSIGPSILNQPPATKQLKFPHNIPIGPNEHTDALILRFMELWCVSGHFHKPSMDCIGAMLLRATGMYEDLDSDLSIPVGTVFLQEMGVISPWDNLLVFRSALAVPGYQQDPTTDRLLQQAEDSVMTYKPSDIMKELRVDWGDLEAFCIDDASAQEIDDAVSLESIPGDNSCAWVHVHAANPSAFIPPDHPMAEYAAHRAESLYFGEKTFNMLPSEVVKQHFSLDKGCPTLTFSVKLNDDGEILDYKITPGIIRNIVYTTPALVLQVLAPDVNDDTKITTYRVGPEPHLPEKPASRKITSNFSPIQIKILERLSFLGRARRRKRIEKGAEVFYLPASDLNLYNVQLERPWRQSIRRIEGDPTIEIKAPVFNPHPDVDPGPLEEARKLVEDLMNLACEAAGLWSKERDIPVMYRGTLADPAQPSAAAFRKDVMIPERERTGKSTWAHTSTYVGLTGKSTTTTFPRKHGILGVDAYARVTSPLRRYVDMFNHWQIQAVLIEEAKVGRPVTRADEVALPFPKAEANDVLGKVVFRERAVAVARRRTTAHWYTQVLFRAHYFGECPVPQEWRVYVSSISTKILRGILRDLSIKCFIEFGENGIRKEEVKEGEWWMMRIARIDILRKTITMMPVRRWEE